ncbi:glutamyl-tRNA amidotransferase, partial [Thioalkalivibrio denitrificans]
MSAESQLKSRITEDMKAAMRAGDKVRLGTIRMALAAIKQVEVDTREALDDAGVLAVLDKMVKQRRESIEQYRKAGRDDLADVEQTELEVIGAYLPEPLSEEEINRLIDSAIGETGAASVRDMGKVMGLLKPQIQGRADMSA